MNEIKKQYQKMQLIKNNNKYYLLLNDKELEFLNNNDYLIKKIYYDDILKCDVIILKFDKIIKSYTLQQLKQRIKAYYIDIENIEA